MKDVYFHRAASTAAGTQWPSAETHLGTMPIFKMRFNINKINEKERPFFKFVVVFITLLFIYTSWLFFYLKIFGVYGVAIIKEGTPSSDGVSIKYEFSFNGEIYSGFFSAGPYAGRDYPIGSKYYVQFSRKDPTKNLLQYNNPVPFCYRDSMNTFWEDIPSCKSESDN